MSDTLVRELRQAETISEVATAIISELIGARGVVVRVGRAAWLAGDAFDTDAIRRALRESDVLDHALPQFAGGVWTVPLFGCGEVIGSVRVATDRDLYEPLVALVMNASVRLAQIHDPPPCGKLTARQREVAVLVARGCTNAEIAELLAISANAVKKHVSRAFAALHVSNRAELAAVAARWKVDGETTLPHGIRVIQVPEPTAPSRRRANAA